MITPWYKQFWPWYVMALPASVVIAGVATVIIATLNKDSLVADNHYKEGLAINRKLDQHVVARTLGIYASMQLDTSNNQLTIRLFSDNPETDSGSYGDTLKLSLIHSTIANRDQHIVVRRQKDNSYIAPLYNVAPGKWRAILQPVDAAWRIESDVDLSATQWKLVPNL